MSRDKGIILSKEHGANPSIDHCRICGREIGLVFFGKLKGDEKAPNDVCSGNLCDDCKAIVEKQGCVIIEVRDGETGKTPYRTGRLAGIDRKVADDLKIEGEAAYLEHTNFEKMFGFLFESN